jgi:hypothetical protein
VGCSARTLADGESGLSSDSVGLATLSDGSWDRAVSRQDRDGLSGGDPDWRNPSAVDGIDRYNIGG